MNYRPFIPGEDLKIGMKVQILPDVEIVEIDNTRDTPHKILVDGITRWANLLQMGDIRIFVEDSDTAYEEK